ncbi:phosphotransferase family protein [Mycolicibacterium neoaurum]|uniref:Aminoglycoside phosphotransferase n=1 Tax=Mycolicibacterium neoaurum TaxID=1795 RepID=A0AAV2WEF7_MYCNE|nr:aminoglycoside phosphotransferase family protein [Mycolicibacterium neoaurum]TLH60807.1 aminoglycoside phosphotransferase family protein [Mycolicibacterium neoaurum]CDQ42491.1 aminoglycoside phosphotransferase [Mycolicibacterium neoaurum]
MIPLQPGEITPAWMSGALRSVNTEPVVDTATVTPVGTGQTGATYRVAVTYTRGGDQLPSSYVVKLPSQDPEVRQRVALGYRSEHAFYTEVAATVAVPTPHCYHIDIANEGVDFVMLMADLAPAVQGDQILGCSATEAALAVEALAGLHGPRWCDPAWLDFGGTTMPRADADIARGMGDLARFAADTTTERLGARISPEDLLTIDRAVTLVSAWLRLEPNRFALLHGDYRLDNLLFDPGCTRVTVVDWQTLAVGLPARDLAYFIATSFSVAERAGFEADLVTAYHRRLCSHGVTGYDVGACWDDYRIGMLQIPLLTMLGFAFSAATERGDDMVLAMLARGCAAIRDLGTLDLIERRS